MRMVGKTTVLLAALLLMANAASAVLINEIRIDNDGTDTDEYFELVGTPLESLSGLTYLVIGDGTGGCGVIEAVLDLSPYTIMSDGYLAVCRNAAPTLTGYDVINIAALNFENSDNVTHMLVSGFTGANAQDLDTDNDGVLDVAPWSMVIDSVGLDEGTVPNCTTDEYLYSPVTVGPDGTFVPGHVFRCANGWNIGPFSWGTHLDSPGADNYECAVPEEASTWGEIKANYR